MELQLKKTYLQIKNMGLFFYVPFVMYYVIIPVFVYAMKQNYFEYKDDIDRITEVCYSIVPIVSIWWVYLQLKTYLESDAREVFYICKGMASQTFTFFLLNVLCYLPIFLMDDADGRIMALFLQMLIIGFFLCSLLLFFSFFMKNIAVSVLFVISYHLFSLSSQEVFFDFQYGNMMGVVDWMQQGVIFFLAGLLFWSLGVKMSHKF